MCHKYCFNILTSALYLGSLYVVLLKLLSVWVLLFSFFFFLIVNNVPILSENTLYAKKSTRETKLLMDLQIYKRFAV